MVVSIGGIIKASEYNALKDSVNKWFGDIYTSNTPASSKATSSYGWGEAMVPAVSIGDLITIEQSNHLINRINLGVTQTGAGSSITKVATGDLISASKHNNIETQAAVIDSARLTSVDHTVTSGGVDGSLSKSSWSNSISITATATFGSYRSARYFFNSGGQLRFSFSCSGTSDDALAWDDLFDSDDMGILIFSYNDVSQTGSRPGNVTPGSGFYELTTTPTQVYNINLDESPYTENDFRMSASRNTDGTQVIITFTMNNDDPQAELVDGNTTIYLDTRKANSKSTTNPIINFSIASPTSFGVGSWSGS